MYFASQFFTAVLAAVLAVGVKAVPTPEDWKTALGWDGAILPASAFGTSMPNATDAGLSKRNIGGIYICTDINFSGTCGYAVQPINSCITLGSDWNNKISSIGPDQGTGVTLYGNAGCNPDVWGTPTITYPGNADLRTIGFNDQASSFWVFAT